MGAANGRLHDPERKTNSSFSHDDSDFSLSATSVEYTDNSCKSSKSVSFQDSEAESGKSEREDGGSGGVIPGFVQHFSVHQGLDHSMSNGPLVREAQCAYPVHPLLRCPNKRVPSGEVPCHCDGAADPLLDPAERLLHRMSPRVYCNGPSTGITQLIPQHGRTSPGQDLGYHTLVTREIPSPTCTTTTVAAPTPTPVPQLEVQGSRYSPSPTCWDVRSTVNVTHLCPRTSPRPHLPLAPQIPLSNTSHLLMTYKGKRLPKSSPFDKLSDDIVLKIFSFLSTNQLCTCSRVCRRWYFLTWEPQLWTTIELTGETIPVDRALRTIFHLLCRDSPSVCLTVEKVILNGCARLSDRGLLAIARHCPELRRLELKGCHNITNGGLFELVSSCANVEHLDVTGCTQINCLDFAHQREFQAPGADALLHSRQLYIQYLDMTDCHGLEDPGLKVIVRSCPQITHLYLRRCVGVTDIGVKYIGSYCVLLRELSVSDCVQVTDFGMYELAKLGPNLRYLSVAKCDQISDAGIKQIARHCYKLRYLNVRGCEAVSDDSTVMLARSCPRLRALDIGKCDVTDHGLKLLSENCPNLKKLSVKSCDMITDKGIQCIAYYCRGLQQLNIQDCQITIEGYRTVKKYCKRCIIEHTNPGFC